MGSSPNNYTPYTVDYSTPSWAQGYQYSPMDFSSPAGQSIHGWLNPTPVSYQYLQTQPQAVRESVMGDYYKGDGNADFTYSGEGLKPMHWPTLIHNIKQHYINMAADYASRFGLSMNTYGMGWTGSGIGRLGDLTDPAGLGPGMFAGTEYASDFGRVGSGWGNPAGRSEPDSGWG